MPRGKRFAERHGQRAERLCALVLRLKGYRILARQWHCPQGEVDIIARRGRLVAMVEVKARHDLTQAAEAIQARQRQRIARAASLFLAARPDLAAFDIRFDAMLVTPWRLPQHVPNAWGLI